MNNNSIDIVIPSFRLDEQYLIPLFDLLKPDGWTFNYIIVVDNPRISVPPTLAKLVSEGEVNLFINEENLGAASSRNKGINAGKGDWILFLDDDIKTDQGLLHAYTNAILESENEIGFIGVTNFPSPFNAFTEALEANHLTTMFKIALEKDRFTWGVTANMMYNREALKGMRFNAIFPKSGGGEDVDLPMRVCEVNHKEFKCLKNAQVEHPWWYDGKPHYVRFMRYGVGTGIILCQNPSLTWIAFPNLVETLFIWLLSFPLFLLLFNVLTWLALPVVLFLIEYGITYAKAYQKKGVRSFTTVFYMILLKGAHHWGTFKVNPLRCFMRRINIGYPKARNFHLNKWKIIKLILYFLLLISLIEWFAKVKG